MLKRIAQTGWAPVVLASTAGSAILLSFLLQGDDIFGKRQFALLVAGIVLMLLAITWLLYRRVPLLREEWLPMASAAAVPFTASMLLRMDPTITSYEFGLSVVEGDIVSPYLYRVLVPFTTAVPARYLIAQGWLEVLAANLIYISLSIVIGLAVTLGAYAFLRQYFNRVVSGIGVWVFVLACLPALYLDGIKFYSWLEIAMLLWIGVLAGRATHHWGYALSLAGMIVLATLNRETGMIGAVLTFLVIWPRDRKLALQLGALLVVAGVVTYGGVRLWRGQAPHQFTFAEIVEFNMTTLRYDGANLMLKWLVILIPGLVGLMGWRNLPSELRLLQVFTLVYLPFILVFGVWQEIRLLAPLLIPLIPLTAHSFQRAILSEADLKRAD